jgi:hypothetical protein
VRKVFAPELAVHRGADRRTLAAALVATSGWPVWESLRAHQGLTTAQARRVLHRMLAALLGAAPDQGR